MATRVIVAIVLVFVLFVAADAILHGMLLSAEYAQTPQLWRQPMNAPLIYVVTATAALCFVGIYAALVGAKSLSKGLMYGFLFGAAVGVPMGYGSFASMPVTQTIALGWLGGSLAKFFIGGLLLGLIVTPRKLST